MQESMGDKQRQVSKPNLDSFSVHELVAAMAPSDQVLDVFQRQPLPSTSTEDNYVSRQDAFARLIQYLWNDEMGPSKRYLQHLTKRFVKMQEEENDRPVESDELMTLIFQIVSTLPSDCLPDQEEMCVLSFTVHPKDTLPLRIRVFPQHNDVALRLWEAGAVLAEYLLHNRSLVQGNRIIELGAGVGLTGLVAVGCCGALDVCMTDYTDACLDNTRHNIAINGDWLDEQRRNTESNENSGVCVSYLDWYDYEDEGPLDDRLVLPSFEALSNADILLTADVAYDWSATSCLAKTIRRFLTTNSSEAPKRVLFATILRSKKSFELFEREIASIGIKSRVLATGSDCDNLPVVFPTNFVQPRNDIRIFSLGLARPQELRYCSES